MNERFETLYKLENNLYKTDAPVIVSAGVLLKDTKTDSIIAQFKFHSVSENTIIALKISIKAYDISNKEVQKIEEYQYLDLNINNGDYFGSDKAIIMPDKVTRLISIDKITVVFDNLTDCEILGDDLVALEKPKTLNKELQDFDLVKQYQIDCDTQGEFIPFEINNLWICTCGEINSSDICNKCKANKDRVLNSYNLSLLQEHLDLRKEQEKAEHEKQKQIVEQKRKEETERAKQKAESEAKQKAKLRKRNKKITIISSIVLTVVALILFTTLWLYPNAIKPYSDYCKAKELLASGQYSEAYAVLESLGDYKDSEQLICENKYKQALDYIKNKDYNNANTILQELGNYKDSEQLICENKYNQALYYIKNKNYNNANTILQELGDYKDLKQLIYENEYNQAIEYINNNDYIKANLLLRNLGNYKDSQSLLDKHKIDFQNYIACGSINTIGLNSDGNVVATGHNENGQCDVYDWKNIIAVSANYYDTVGLKSDGTIVVTGNNVNSQCNVTNWKDIIAVSSNEYHTVGLKSNATVVATGYNRYGQCDVRNWENIVAVSTGEHHTVGLKSDGTVVATGKNSEHQCNVSG